VGLFKKIPKPLPKVNQPSSPPSHHHNEELSNLNALLFSLIFSIGGQGV